MDTTDKIAVAVLHRAAAQLIRHAEARKKSTQPDQVQISIFMTVAAEIATAIADAVSEVLMEKT